MEKLSDPEPLDGPVPDGDGDGHWEYVRTLGEVAARRVGLKAEDVEDCAAEFLGRMLILANRDGSKGAVSWLPQRADYCARDYLRRLLRRQERRLLDGDAELRLADRHWTSPHDSPEAYALRADLYRQLGLAISRLRARPRELVIRYHILGQSMAVVARETGDVEHAVAQVLFTARRRLRRLLRDTGIDEAVVDDYIGRWRRGSAEPFHGPRDISD